MRIIISINHPSQYYIFKYLSKRLIMQGHVLLFIIKDKDILEKLMLRDGQRYLKIVNRRSRKSKLSIIIFNIVELLIADIKLFFIAGKFKPDLLVGTDIPITHIGKLLKVPSIVFNEDDYSINKLFCKFSYPFATYILSPKVCDVGKYEKKKISYDGYQKLSYLHPSVFLPDRKIVLNYLGENKYFIIRLVSLNAAHDIESKHKGISINTVKELITILEKKGKVFITSERKMEPSLEKYRLKIDPLHIHHFLFYADLFIGDSQSMIVECAMLGTPSIRVNTFVGKISVLNELENKYRLTIGINPSEKKRLIELVDELTRPNVKSEFQKRRNIMLKEKLNVNQYFFDLINNFPESVKK